MLERTKALLEKDQNLFTISEVKELGEVIQYHSDLYYNKEEPIISDYDYDILFKKLSYLENKFDLEQSSLLVGADVIESSFKKVKHSRPMISLDNTYNEVDLLDFNERVKKRIDDTSKEFDYTIEFKFDGLGVELIYKEGQLIQAITRGNGVEGEDVTENVKQIANIPQTIEYKDHLEVRGEVVMPISVFNSLNEVAKKEGTKIFSNPRNAASGSLRMKDNSITKKRKLQFFAYDLANFEEFRIKESKDTYFDVIQDLKELGFDISSYFIACHSIQDVVKEIDNFGDIKEKIDFEIDGLVLKVNTVELWKDIGSTEHHPRYAIAYKFPAEILTTQILSVEHSVGRTGTITPVANLEAINIGGVVVRRATLHNYEEVESLDVRIGDTVFIKRAGEVIPKIISVVKEARVENTELILAPTICPSCDTRVLKDDAKVRFYCPNFSGCPKQVLEQISWAVGKQGFNIDGLGQRQVEVFLQEGIISDLASIFTLSEKKDQILGLEGFQQKSVDKLLTSVELSKQVSIITFLTGLGISGVGKKTAKNIAKLFTGADDVLAFTHSIEVIESIDDVGPEIAQNIYSFFTGSSEILLLGRLVALLDIEYYNASSENLSGKYFEKKMCITGSFAGFSRDQLIVQLEEQGGEFTSSVSKKTDFLLAGEKAGSKLKKANDLGVEVLKLEDFLV